MDVLLKQNQKTQNSTQRGEKNAIHPKSFWQKMPPWFSKVRDSIFPHRLKHAPFKKLISPELYIGDSAIQKLILGLDQSETIPVLFSKNPDQRFADWLVAGDFLLSRCTHKSEEHFKLMQRLAALRYRLEGSNGGLDPEEFHLERFHSLRNLAVEWKKAHPLIGQAILSPKELTHLKKAARYPDFAQVLVFSSQIREAFFNWILRDENEVAPFIEFPATVEKILVCGLSGRISRFGGTALQIHKEKMEYGYQKILTLPFEGLQQNILSENAVVTFRGCYTLSVKEIFHIFSQKEISVGNLEFMKEGIVNWNIHHLGYWDDQIQGYVQIDVNEKEWWKQMPLLEVLHRKQVMKRYNLELKPHAWVAAEVATRGRANLDFMDTHAYLEVAIPIENKQYAIYDFGKLSWEYPATAWDKLRMLTKTVHATVAYPDENVFYTHRQRGFHPLALDPKEGKALMELIRRDILTSRERNFIYQIQSENCAKWVHTRLERVLGKEAIPDLFRMQLLDTEPVGVVAHIFQWIKKLPENWRLPVFTFLHLPLGAARKIWICENGQKVAKSLSTHTFFKTGEIFLPALLIAKISHAQPHGLNLLRNLYVRARTGARTRFLGHEHGHAQGHGLCKKSSYY
jgi:hypothetical protein